MLRAELDAFAEGIDNKRAFPVPEADVLATLSASRTKTLTGAGHSQAAALTGGYHLAYMVAAGCVTLGIIAAFLVLRPPAPGEQEIEEQAAPQADVELVAA